MAQNTDHAFDYDQTAPLDEQENGTTKRGAVSVLDISYASPKGGRVPAYLVVPSGKGPFAAVIWGHWYWSNSPARNRNEFLDEAVALAASGVVSLLTDGPVARPEYVKDDDPLSERQPAELIQQIIDMRRGADLLLARRDVDPQRIAYVGHSYNATVGAFLSGIDKRFKAFVLMAGGLSHEVDMKSKEYQGFRQKVGPEKLMPLRPGIGGSILGNLFPEPRQPSSFCNMGQKTCRSSRRNATGNTLRLSASRRDFSSTMRHTR